VLDSLSVLSHLPAVADARIADVGSGGGLPGIPLAVCRRDWRVTLIESSRKKAAFLAQAAIELPLSNVDVVAERVERYRPPVAFDIAISRAYASLASFATQARHLIVPGGWLAAMKGVYPRDEIAALPSEVSVTEVVALHVPGIRAQRHLVLMQSASS
jgi:16S rRNA (guanine527-N7)-methyltransferase